MPVPINRSWGRRDACTPLFNLQHDSRTRGRDGGYKSDPADLLLCLLADSFVEKSGLLHNDISAVMVAQLAPALGVRWTTLEIGVIPM